MAELRVGLRILTIILITIQCSIKAGSIDEIDITDLRKETESLSKNTEIKNNQRLNVIYVTPWTDSKEIVVKYANKIDILIPCWFELKPERLNSKYHTQVT